MAVLILVAGFAFFRHANLVSGPMQERESVLRRLALAKDALLTYAVLDSTRPGRLPCPNLNGDGSAALLTREECDAYSGWLPWKTLDIVDRTDDQGAGFRYALSPAFGGNHTTLALNSDTTTTLRLDVPQPGSSNEIVAILIATRGQPDPRNADGDDYYFNGTSTDPDNNDIVLAITRSELMAAVEQRIANELRTCLEQHASHSSNPQRTYPWPAPLGVAPYKGMAASLFGMIADTQPGNPELALKESIANLAQSRSALTMAGTASEQLAAASQLQAQAAYARALFDQLYLLTVALNDKATQAASAFRTLDDTIVDTTASKSVYQTQSATLPASINTAIPLAYGLRDALLDSGFDLFISELQSQNSTLKTRFDAAAASPTTTQFNALITPINQFKNSLLEYSGSRNNEVEAVISAAYAAAVKAADSVNLARKSTQEPYISQALNDSLALYVANQSIEANLLARRTNLAADEVSYRATRLSNAAAEFLSTGATQTLNLLIESTQTLLSSLAGGGSAVISAKSASANALAAVTTLLTSNTDRGLINTQVLDAVTQLNALATALSSNGDNIAADSLQSAISVLSAASLNLPANVTDARALRQPTKTIIYWSDIAVSRTADIARLARKGITAQEDSDTSAYTAARRLLDSLDGSTGTLAYLNSYAKTPNEETRQAAQSALNATMALLDSLLSSANKLDGELASSMAAAGLPTIWYGSACSVLQPATGSPTWWSANNWKSLFFYQIADRVRPTTGSLSVNGAGSYRVVVVSAGRGLTGQNRSLREVGQYLEKTNADASRNGLAQNPTPRFITETLSPTFNDRLAY